MRHALTVDVEDWPQSTLDHSLPVTERAVRSTHRLLELFGDCHVKGTFFILGLLAEKFPHLVRDIDSAGHEIASHGYSHKPVHAIGPDAFADELDRSQKLLQDITGQDVRGYRAPDFSVTEQSLWALDVLAEHGFAYDSSIMPVKMRRYGIDGFPRHIHRRESGLVEVPLSVTTWLGRRWPVAGGGYLRLYPYRITASAIRKLEAEQLPAVVYLHPYELDPTEVHETHPPVPLRTKLTQGLNRKRIADRLIRLVHEFNFAPLSDVIRDRVDSRTDTAAVYASAASA